MVVAESSNGGRKEGAELGLDKDRGVVLTCLDSLLRGSEIMYSRVNTMVNIGSYTMPFTGTLSRSTNVVPNELLLLKIIQCRANYTREDNSYLCVSVVADK